MEAIKDVFIRFHLKLDKCRDQTYDSTSNIMCKNSGVVKQITDEQPKLVTIHCHGHLLSLTVKSLTNNCKIP